MAGNEVDEGKGNGGAAVVVDEVGGALLECVGAGEKDALAAEGAEGVVVLVGGDLADDDEAGFAGAVVAAVLGKLGEGSVDDFLIGAAGVVDDGGGCVGGGAVLEEFVGDGLHGFDGHVVEGGEGAFVFGVAGGDFACGGAGGEGGEAAGDIAAGEEHAGAGGGGLEGADAGDDAVGEGEGFEGVGLFCEASEDAGVTAFEADDALAAAGVVAE